MNNFRSQIVSDTTNEEYILRTLNQITSKQHS